MKNHHVIKGTRILPFDKLSSEEINLILISNIVNKPTSNIYFEKLFENTTLDWKNRTCHHFQQLLTLPCVLFNIKFLITYFSLIKNYTLLFALFVTLQKKLLYTFSLTVFMLNDFGKDYGQIFRKILFLMKQMAIIIFGVIS